MSNIDDTHSNASSFDEADDQDWADWIDDEEGQKEYTLDGQSGIQPREGSFSGMNRTIYHALFLDQTNKQLQAFKTPKEALDHCKKVGCDVPALIKKANLDALQVIRLFNHLRRQVIKGEIVNTEQINQLSGREEFLNDDDELKPVKGFENDGLLQLDFDDLDAEL